MSTQPKHIASHTMRLVVVSLIVLVVVTMAFILVIQSFDRIRAFIEEDVEKNIRTVVSNSELSRSLASLEIDINQMMTAAIGQPEKLKTMKQEIMAAFDTILQKVEGEGDIIDTAQVIYLLDNYRSSLENLLKTLVDINSYVVRLTALGHEFASHLNNMESAAGGLMVNYALEGKDTAGLQQVYSLIPYCNERVSEADILVKASVTQNSPLLLGVGPSKKTDEQKTVTAAISQLRRTLRTFASSEEEVTSHTSTLLSRIPRYMEIIKALDVRLRAFTTDLEHFDTHWNSVMSTLSEIDSQTSGTIEEMKTNMYGRMTATSSIIYIISALVLAISVAGWIFIRKIGLQMERTANDALMARAELQRSHNELEMRVQERTMDLQKTNEQLQHEIIVRETAEEELKAREEQFRSYFELGNIGMAIISGRREWLRINDYLCTLLGYSKEELMHLTWADITYPEDLDRDVLNFDDMLSGKTDKYKTDKRFMKKNGDIIFANITMACQRNPDGSVNYFITSVQDITERMKVEEALQKERDKAQVYLNIAGVMIGVLDADGTVVLINQKGSEMLGYDEEYIVGKNWFHSFLPERIKDEMFQVFQKLMEGNIEPVEYYENPVLTKTNEERMIAFHNTLIENQSGNVTAILFSGEDITERKKLEEQLLQAQKMEAVGQLAGGVAHDFNNILTAIISYSHLLKNRLGEDDWARDNIEKILSLSSRATSITRDLLTFSRKQYFEFTPAKLNDIIRNIEKLLAKFIPEDIELKTNFAKEDLSVIADTTQIEQVIMNLVTNARDAMSEGGELILETKQVHIDDTFIKLHGFGQPGRYALLSVSDTGTGFEEEIRQKIFEPFFTTKEVGKGSGLGLAIVYGIIKQHNGYINVYSEPEKGTTVKIYLPEIKSEFKGEIEEVLPDLTGKGETILVAEDEATVMDSMKNILHEFGYKVIEAVDGLDAVEKFKQHKDNIHLVILDVVMPRMNGKETYDEIRKIRPEIKVLFTSGYTADIIEKKKVLRDDFVFISKPILPDKLLSKIRDALEG